MGRHSSLVSFDSLDFSIKVVLTSFCILSENFLLTAAHCVDGLSSNEIKAYFGGHNITQDYTDMRRIKKIHQHESFNIFSFDNDIALLELQKAVKFGSKVQPACLPDGCK